MNRPSSWRQHQRCLHPCVRRWTIHALPGASPSATNQQLTHFGFSQSFEAKFEMEEFLGQGSFGTVHIAKHRSTGRRYAVKTVTKKKLGQFLEPHFVRRVQHEVDIYNHMGKSLNVAHLHGVYENETCVDMVMQLCTGGELWGRIKKGEYGEAQAARIIREILRAVAQCHSRGVVVRDVKPENFLFLDDSPDAPLKMIDFGIAQYCVEGQVLEDRAGSPIYCAPEVLKKRYSQKADVWSAGIIAYELLAARLPFQTEDGPLADDLRLSRQNLTNKEIFSAILFAPLDFEQPPWDCISPLAKDFVQRLLTRDPEMRPTATEALAHPWLAVSHEDPNSNSRQQASGVPEQARSSPAPGLMDDSLVQRLQRYGTWARLKQVSLSKVAGFMRDYDEAALTRLSEALGSVSLTVEPLNGGVRRFKIPYQQMVDVLKNGRYELSDTEVVQLLSSFKIDADGCMDVSEWLAALTDWQEVQDTQEWEQLVDRAFSAIDTDNSGALNVQELEALLCDEEGCAVEDTIPAVLREVDTDARAAEAEAACVAAAEAAIARRPGQPAPPPQRADKPSAQRSGAPVLDRTAFMRLLRMAKQDRLELYQSRKARRPGATGAASQSVSSSSSTSSGSGSSSSSDGEDKVVDQLVQAGGVKP